MGIEKIFWNTDSGPIERERERGTRELVTHCQTQNTEATYGCTPYTHIDVHRNTLSHTADTNILTITKTRVRSHDRNTTEQKHGTSPTDKQTQIVTPTKHIAVDEIEHYKELRKIVLQRCSREEDALARVHTRQSFGELRVRVLQSMSLIADHQVEGNGPELLHVLPKLLVPNDEYTAHRRSDRPFLDHSLSWALGCARH
jgi:hypothetical protein